MTTLPKALAALVRQNDGLITRRRAAAAHVAPTVVEAALRLTSLRRLRPGVFVEASRWESATPHERYVLMVRGVLLDRPGWLASHHAALALFGLPLHGIDSGHIDVVAAVRTSKRRPGLHVHVATPEQRTLIGKHDVNRVGVADACILTAVASGFESGVVAMDAAVHRGLITPAALSDALRAAGIRYGIDQPRAAIAAIDPKCESPGETRTRLILQRAGLDVASQVNLRDAQGFIGRVDLLVDGRVVVEFDGAVKYAGLDGKRALMEEKRREERLRDAGYRVVRVTWADLSRPEKLVARVRSHLAAA